MDQPATASLRFIFGYLLVAALGLALTLSRGGEALDYALLDREFAALRRLAPTPVPAQSDVVIIGLDEQAFITLPEPSSLWHPYLGKLFAALATVKPAVVGLDMALPVRSYNFLKNDYDRPLLDGLRQLSKAAPLVTGRFVNGRRRLRPILPEVIAAAGGNLPASLTLCREHGTVRRIALNLCAEMDERATLTSAMGQALGLRHSGEGLIDYSVGGELSYLPLLQVLGWIDRGDQERLRTAFAGRAVLIGSLFPTDERYAAPAALAAWEPGNRMLHGVVLHAQALRAMLTKGLVQPLSQAMVAVLSLLAAGTWFGTLSRRKTLLFLASLICLLPLSLFALWQGIQVPLASLMAVALLGFGARMVYDGRHSRQRRSALRSAFSGYVGPAAMKALHREGQGPRQAGERCRVAVLFAKVRGLAAGHETGTPEATIALLNRCYAEMSAAVHGHQGMVHKLIGDGLLASFGTPQALAQAERNALEAAQDMLRRLDRLNRQRAEGAQAGLEIGIGVHAGEALVGLIGSQQRHDFVMLGDVVDSASRIEGAGRGLGYPVVCTAAVASAVGNPDFLIDLGAQALPDHAPLQLFGWRPVERPPQAP